jgi:hypothetical protein
VGPITGAISFDKNPRAYLFSQIEIVAAVGPSIRIGVNPGEILDFVVGWLGFDLYDDDIYRYRDEARRLGEFRLSLEAESTATNKPNQHNE